MEMYALYESPINTYNDRTHCVGRVRWFSWNVQLKCATHSNFAWKMRCRQSPVVIECAIVSCTVVRLVVIKVEYLPNKSWFAIKCVCLCAFCFCHFGKYLLAWFGCTLFYEKFHLEMRKWTIRIQNYAIQHQIWCKWIIFGYLCVTRWRETRFNGGRF